MYVALKLPDFMCVKINYFLNIHKHTLIFNKIIIKVDLHGLEVNEQALSEVLKYEWKVHNFSRMIHCSVSN